MLRKRSIAPASSKQGGGGGFMQDLAVVPSSPSSRISKPASSFFPSPRLLVGGFAAKAENREAAMSPASILETKPFASIVSPLLADRQNRLGCGDSGGLVLHSHIGPSGKSGPIGLGLVDALRDGDCSAATSKKESRMVLFGSQLKIQIPLIGQRPISPTGSVGSPHSPIEFGIKTMNSHTVLLSPSCLATEGAAAASPCVFSGMLSPTEMELSEDYTRVITHGPNPKTTHFFDNCKIESCGDSPVCPSDIFLRFCYTCGKNLGQSKDIFMFRGEKAFCSRECRCKEIEKLPPDVL